MTDHRSGTLARLSREALRAAEAEGLADARSAAEFLYRFNSANASDRWRREHADRRSTAKALGAGRGSVARSLLREHWLEAGEDRAPGWWVWTARHAGDELGGPGPEFKLYVSPAVEMLRPTFETLVEVLPSSRALSFKVGADAMGLLRPDKIVVYFSDLGDLTAAAHRLADRLREVAPQGVPFTSEIGRGGLLSWSVDPPVDARHASGPRPTWRAWITNRAGLALSAALREGERNTPAWRRAVERLRHEGVDVERWLPAATLWSSASAWR